MRPGAASPECLSRRGRVDREYLQDLEHRARRFSGAYTGTSGTLAGGILHLLNERRSMAQTIEQLEQHNQALRQAVESRLGGCCEGARPCQSIDTSGPILDPEDQEDDGIDKPLDIPVDWILRGEQELKREQAEARALGDGLLADNTPAAEKLLLEALDTIRQRRSCYGPPGDHFAKTVGMINAAFGSILKRPLTQADWAIFMVLDKVSRYCGPQKTTDGPIDLAGYAACLAEVEAG